MAGVDDVVRNEAIALLKSAARLEREATVQKQRAVTLFRHLAHEQPGRAGEREEK